MFSRRPLIGEELTDWQFDAFAWLLCHTDGMPTLGQRQPVQPIAPHFPQRGLSGHALAKALFEQTKMRAGMASWPCTLQRQEEDPDALVAPTLLIAGAPSSPSGTFHRGEDGIIATYNPARLGHPMSLIATLDALPLAVRLTTTWRSSSRERRRVTKPTASSRLSRGVSVAESRNSRVPIHAQQYA